MKTELIYGFHSVQVLLKSQSDRIQEILVQDSRRDERLNKVLSQAQKQDIPIRRVKKQVLDKDTDGNHQGLVAVCSLGELHDEKYLYDLLEGLTEPAFLLILDGVTDPHNLGACLRSADAAGVHAVIAPKDKSATLNATVRKVACGAAEAVPLIPVTNLARTMEKLRQQGVWITGAAGEGDKDIFDQDLTGSIAIAMGAEGDGLRRLSREHCDFLAKIPMSGSVSSLNVSVATGVFLFEACRQRR